MLIRSQVRPLLPLRFYRAEDETLIPLFSNMAPIVAVLFTEYTAYSSMLSIFKRLVPVPTALSAEDKYKLHTEKLKKTIQ